MRRIGLLLLLLASLILFGCGTRAQQPSPSNANFLQAQLRSLDEMAAPQGVKAADWYALKGGLRGMIKARLADVSARSTSSAPVSPGARSQLFYDVDRLELQWDYANPGDYDQNGEVNISDLTPLAVHLGEAVADPERRMSIQSVVDGDANGLITIADLTPLGANLGNRVTNYQLYTSTSSADIPEDTAPSTVAPFGIVPFASFSGTPSVERLRFAVAHANVAFPADPGYYWVRPFDIITASEGAVSKHLQAGILEPSFSLSATPLAGSAPVDAQLNASEHSPDCQYFDWDEDGDGIFEVFGTDDTRLEHLTENKLYTFSVRVTSVSRLIKSAGVEVNLSGAARWYRYTLSGTYKETDQPRAVGMGVYDSRPYMLRGFYDPTTSSGTLADSRSPSVLGNIWPSLQDFIYSSTGEVTGAQTALLEGQPTEVSTVYGSDSISLLFSGSSFGGSGWSGLQTLDAFPSVSGIAMPYFSYKTIGALPAVAYQTPDAGDLKFIYSLDPDGAGWSAAQTLQSGPADGYCASLADVGGKPGLVWVDQSLTGVMRYADAPVLGAAWTPSVALVNSALGTRFFDSLLVLKDGSPAVAYYSPTVAAVRFRRADDSSGDTWGGGIQIAAAPDDPRVLPRAVMVDDLPHVFWYDPSSGSLLHSSPTDSSGATWVAADVVSGAVDPVVMFSPVDLHGIPAVGFVSTSGTYRFALRY